MSLDTASPSPVDFTADGHYRAIVESAIDFAIIATDLGGRVTDWSSGAAQIFGWSAADMLGQGLERLHTSDDLAAGRPARNRQRALETGRAEQECEQLRRDGTRVFTSGETTPLRDAAGAHRGYVTIVRDITARQRDAAELREARGLSDLILNSSRDCIVVLDVEGHTLALSPGGVESMEVGDVPAILGLSWLRVWKGADHDAAVAAVAAARAGGTGRFRGFCPTHKGTPKWWDIVISPLPGADGRPERLVSIGRDITERMVAEIQFEAVAEAMPGHVWTARPDGMLDWFNERVYVYSGARRGTLDGRGWGAIVHPDDLDAATARWAAAAASGQPYESEFRLRAVDGTYRWHIGRALPIKGADGAILRWVGTNTDIEEERTARDALAERAAALTETVQARTRERDRAWKNSQDLQAILDAAGRFQSINDRWTEVLGWSTADIVGRHFLEFVHPDDLGASSAALATAAGGVLPGHENRYAHKSDGWRWISWVASHDGDTLIASGRHITAERQAAAELAIAQDQLRQSQKMEAVGQLTGGVAHDFNNILQVISGNLHLLGRFGAGDARIERRVESSQAAVTRGAKLASQLLAFSRRQPLAPKVVNAGRLVAGMEDMLRRALGEAIEIEFVSSGSLWNTLVDPAQVENAVLNLAINARDAMEGRGKLTIEVGNVALDAAYARHNAEVTPGQYMMLAVSDTGSGMSPEVMARAFEPFFSTKAVGTGTGLGLSMIYGFARQSGGHAKIYSEPGHGTTMKLYLPRCDQPEEVAADTALEPVVGGRETILVAEDDDGVRATVVEMLGELGYVVLQARDGVSALNVVESGVGIDLLFTDVVMPGALKSTELAHRARNRIEGLRVLYTSGYTQNAIVHGGRLDAGVDLLVKPYTRDDLARKVRQVLGRGAVPPGDGGRQDAAPSSPPAAPPHPERARTVLLVEDDDAIRATTGEMLRALGYEVVDAANAEEALTVLDQVPVQLVLTDLGLPGMSGETFAAHVRRTRPWLKVVYVTGLNVDADQYAAEAATLLHKPYDMARLAQALATTTAEAGS